MANGYLGVGDSPHRVKGLYVGVDGTARKVKKAYVGVNGTARMWYQAGTPLGELAVGSIVKLKVNGVSEEFIVVHQGNPDPSIYDSSCDGTWLLMKDIYEKSTFAETYNNYVASRVDSYLKNTFFDLIDAGIQSTIKNVKIPYWKGNGTNGELATGANGLSRKVFALSGYEVGFTVKSNQYFPKDGACLSYFIAENSDERMEKRIAYYNGSAAVWRLRSPRTNNINGTWTVGSGGGYKTSSFPDTDNYGVRPAFILPSTVPVDEENNVIA